MKKDIVVLPKSVTPARISANLTHALGALSKLTDEDVKVLDGIAAGGKQKRFVTPPWGEHFLFIFFSVLSSPFLASHIDSDSVTDNLLFIPYFY